MPPCTNSPRTHLGNTAAKVILSAANDPSIRLSQPKPSGSHGNPLHRWMREGPTAYNSVRPVIARNACIYFCRVRATTSSGSPGAGARLFHRIDSR